LDQRNNPIYPEGPNIAYFSKAVSLQEMTDHIYGRTNIITDNSRPHLFINELFIYITYLKERLLDEVNNMDNKREKYFLSFYNQLKSGIKYYRELAQPCNGFTEQGIEDFNDHLDKAELELEALCIVHPVATECVENTLKTINQKYETPYLFMLRMFQRCTNGQLYSDSN
jgi:hypothetical protein